MVLCASNPDVFVYAVKFEAQQGVYFVSPVCCFVLGVVEYINRFDLRLKGSKLILEYFDVRPESYNQCATLLFEG